MSRSSLAPHLSRDQKVERTLGPLDDLTSFFGGNKPLTRMQANSTSDFGDNPFSAAANQVVNQEQGHKKRDKALKRLSGGGLTTLLSDPGQSKGKNAVHSGGSKSKWIFGTKANVKDQEILPRPIGQSRPTSPVGRMAALSSSTASSKNTQPLVFGWDAQSPPTSNVNQQRRLGPLKNLQSFVQGTEADQERRTASGFAEQKVHHHHHIGRRERRGVTSLWSGRTNPLGTMDDTEPEPCSPGADRDETSWLLLRPSRRRVDKWLDNWWRRWWILVGVPCLIVWAWCAVPFPVSDPYKGDWNLPWPADPPNNQSSSSSASTWPAWPKRVVGLARLASHFGHKSPSSSSAAGSQTLLTWTIKHEPDQSNSHPPESLPSPPEEELPVDSNFYFFLFAYYGVYVAVALIFITKLFDLYRLNWWPTSLGGSASYIMFWSLSLLIGFLLHRFDLDGLGRRTHNQNKKQDESFDWERKTTWILLAFFAMTLPAVACFAKLRADRRNSYRRSLTAAQRTFLERQQQRMPRSYKRFLWFLLTLTLSLCVLLIGQAFATVYLSTLPHNNLDGLTYVWTWIATCTMLNAASNWILETKVRSRALVFVFRYYYFLVYHIFYRNLFARLRSPDQAFWIQLLSSSFVIVWYPLSMSRRFHRFLIWAFDVDKDWEEYAESVGTMLYLRNLSENVTMVAFLGWLTILHFGPNKAIYPFFAFDTSTDPYNYRLTAIASLIIWATELGSSLVARVVIWWGFGLDVTNLGLNEFRDHPELVVACVWTSVHVCMDILLFLIKLNFR
ncbi:hypothetical protein OIO90_001649 [Microbotryomycetes sp. JL221]|nr:hypothetical protein OIO90_001649 [Microbotryomycetes sp. JL221]